MKKSLILLFACVQWLGALAQSQGNTKSDEKLRIPITPIVVDGEVTGVPDGTPIVFCYRVKKTREYRNARNTLTTTIQNGKFHIEKKFL